MYVFAQADGGLDPGRLTSRALSDFLIDALHAVVLDGTVEVRNSQSKPIDYTVTSESGAGYTGPMEPPAHLLFESGFEV